MSRPELTAPPQLFYDDSEAHKYTSSSRVIEIQDQLTERAVELLNFPDDDVPKFLLDVGCGSGLSGDRLTELGHEWIGIDISASMLEVARDRRKESGLVRFDMGHGCPFRPGVFDGCISISAIQWLCNADNSLHEPRKRLGCFFTYLYRCLKSGARAVLQFYPNTAKQAEMISTAALRVGFSGGLVVDYPNSTRAKKYFLVLSAGPMATETTAQNKRARAHAPRLNISGRSNQHKQASGPNSPGHQSTRPPENQGRKWILKKKEQARKRGKTTAADSKYSGRKRKDRL